MLKCSLQLREATSGAPTLEASAQRLCRFFYDEMTKPAGGKACALVRCYKTHDFGGLDPELQKFAKGVLGVVPPASTMKVLTLMATVGETASWNSRHLSQGHKAIPLPSPEIVEKAPMIAQLIKEFGLELRHVLKPSADLLSELAGKRYGVFHVAEAKDSPYIPAQKDFVDRHGIRSVLGCGGMLASGDLFAVILFTNVHVPPASAERFRTLALDVKSGFSRFTTASIFNQTKISAKTRTEAV
ncbi:MAG TPA: hypothetical protein VNJ04_12745 [Gemmatimonadaceae bacterium]|nr:hypothetical protein [Gemmatimonadaceae bacterium]